MESLEELNFDDIKNRNVREKLDFLNLYYSLKSLKTKLEVILRNDVGFKTGQRSITI